MPELVEVEAYRRLAEDRALGRRIDRVDASDAWYLKRGLTAAEIEAALQGAAFTAAWRRGKLLLMDLDEGGVLGLRFGMSGRLVVDGQAGVEGLLYTTNIPADHHDRFTVGFADGGELRMRDPRRLGGVELDPDVGRLGPDAATVTVAGLRAALAGSGAPLKARLLDQARLAGVGNLIADEVLWRAALSPERPAGGLDDVELRRLRRQLLSTIARLIDRDGSHTGDLLPERHRGGHCPKDGAELARATVGGRTTWWCPRHQR